MTDNQTVEVYGLKNCDTCRKATRWLDDHGVDFAFIDVRNPGADETALRRWADRLGWEALVNKRSRTWRELSTAQQNGLDNETVVTTLRDYPTLMKRPVLTTGDEVSVGFSEHHYASLFDDRSR